MIAKGTRTPRTRKKVSLNAYALGELMPARLVEPADAAEAAAALRGASDAGEAVVVFGGGTLQRAANAPSRYDVAVSTKRLTALHDYDPRDLTAGVGAGMTVADLQRALAQHRQFLPLDVPLAQQATVGGTLAAGWAGPRRAAYGRPRDLLIGTTVALANGTLASSGGMVVKNVTGYDMGKLYVGSHGTLGAIVRANFKVLPAPAVRRLAIAPFDEELRERALAHAIDVALEPVALLAIDGFREAAGPAGPRLVALLEGSEAVVDRATRELRSALGAAGIAETRLLDGDDAARAFQSVLDAYVARDGETSLTLLARGLPSEAAARAQRVRTAIRRAETIADLRTGDVVVRVREAAAASADDDAAPLDRVVRDVLGHASVLSSGAATRADAWGEAPATLLTMRALKAQFDPQGVLAPGRFVGGI
ncbi:MAG: FAD-binding oxidoreductase [Candidatus Eremiobacteraeota bacterium]|nr:FAD-binding oxidoreductase [Candidatus Eremiobacteraeota bacterium]